MRRMLLLILVVLLAAAAFAPDSEAWIPTRTGQRNFERAWAAFLSQRRDDAMTYFAKAADAYAQALAEKPPTRTTLFPSNLTMAGISAYYAGRYDLAIQALGMALDRDDSIWEGYLYTGLAYARQGNSAKAMEFLEKYVKSNPSQPILSSAVLAQVSAVETEGASLDQVAPAVEQGAFDQFHNNMLFVGNRADSPADGCSGAFWWRNNRAPCSRNLNFTGGMSW